MKERAIARTITKTITGNFAERRSFPLRISLQPTNRCNLACLTCVTRGRPPYEPDKELSKDEYLRIVREAAELGVKIVDVCGNGEPFHRPEVTLAILRAAKEHGLYASVSTNGTLLTEEIVETLVAVGLDEVRFSMNGPDAETDDYLRGRKGIFHRCVKTMALFNHFKETLGRTAPRISIAPVVTSRNHDKLEGFLRLARDLKISRSPSSRS